MRRLRPPGGPLILALGLLILAAGVGLLGADRAPRLTGYNDAPVQIDVATLPPGASACQPREPLWEGTGAVRLAGRVEGGPVAIRAMRASSTGSEAGPWVTHERGAELILPVPPGRALDPEGRLCVANRGPGTVVLSGVKVEAEASAVVTGGDGDRVVGAGRARIEGLTAARPRSLWSVADRLPERIGAATGVAAAPWLVAGGLVVALLAAALLLAARRPPRTDLVLVVALTLASGTVWASFTPAFHTTDEPAHFAYVQAVAELGHPPRALADAGTLSGELACWYDGLRATQVRFAANERPPWTAAERRALEDACEGQPREHDGAMYHAFQPPGYYLPAAVAYEIGGGLSLPVRVLLGRLVGVLLAAVAVACAYLLVRELVPGSPWPARAGALALAFQPVFMFNEAAVNPDALVVAVASGIALVAARAWRRGLTLERALALGLLLGIGLWSKANFLLLLPSVALLCAALFLATRPGQRRAHAARLGAAALVALACLGLYALVNGELWDRALTYRQPAYSATGGSVSELLSFGWQFFLPALPFMQSLYDQPPVWSSLLQGVTGRFGWWNDFGLPVGAIAVILLGATAIVALALAYLLPRLRRRPWPAAVAAMAGVGFLAALVVADYQYSVSAGATGFEGRYVLPLAPLWALVVGCAVAALPSRWRPAATGLLTTAFVAHTIVALAATVGRYYV